MHVTKTAAVELGEKPPANALAPGFIERDVSP